LHFLSLAAAIVAGLAFGLGFIRFALPAVFRYLERRTIAAWRVLVAEYIAGRVSLDAAAAKFNELEYRAHRYRVRALRLRPGGPSYLRSISLTPPDCRDDDPRLDALTERAALLHFGPERYAEIRARQREERTRAASSKPEAPA